MILKKVIIAIVALLVQQVYCQQGEIEYKTIYVDNPNDGKDKDFKRKMAREINDMAYLLRYDAKQSYLEELPHVPHDEFMAKIASIVASSHINWYQFVNDKKPYYNKKIKDSMYRVFYTDRMTGWELKNETKNIDGYTCYKATLLKTLYTENEYTVEAWYTPEIPVPFGPVGYGGLPGLILQLTHRKVTYIAKKVTLNPTDGIKPIPDLKDGRPISVDEKMKLQRQARKVTED